MAQRRRRATRALEDLPGLFDNIEVNFTAPEPNRAAAIVEEHRKKQSTVHNASLDLDNGVLKVRRKMQFISFGSGSSGNCAYLGISGSGGILIDAGVDSAKVLAELERNCIPLEKIAGIVLTHDHSDHVKYAYPLLRKIPGMALYCTPRTLNGLLRRHSVSRRIKDFHKGIFKEFAFEAGPFSITPFDTSHDGTDNVGYCIAADAANFVVATDMGMITDRADYYIKQANYLMIEANYDNMMLADGTYPEYLKARIRSERGHLDNAVTAEYLASIWQKGLTDIYLCHLSLDNNKPEIALAAVHDALAAKGISVGDASGSAEALKADVQLCALPRFDSSPLFIHRF